MTKLGFVCLLLALPAAAGTGDETQYWKKQDAYLQTNVDAAASLCGVKFTFTWIDKPAMRAGASQDHDTPNSICSAVVDEIGSICRLGDEAKASVQKTVRGFACGYAKPRRLAIEKGVVIYSGNNKEDNFSDWARPLLLKSI